MSETRPGAVAAVALAAAFVLAYVAPLDLHPLIIPDETRYAEIPREMLASGDWVVPRLNGLRYFEKPPLGYWVTAASVAVFGQNDFAVRLPFALAAGLAATLLGLLVRHRGGGPPVALVSASVYLSSVGVFAIGIYATLDGLLSMLLTACLVAFYFGHTETRRTRKSIYWLACGVCCGLAFLTKGFLAFVVPGIVIGAFALWERALAVTLKWSWLAVMGAALVALPWALAIHAQEADFWPYFFWNEHVRRFAADNAQHAEPAWFYLPVLLGGMLPWTLLLPVAVRGLFKIGMHCSLVRFSLVWSGLPFLFFTLSRGKLPTYILPCFAPLAMLVAIGTWRELQSGPTKSFRLGISIAVAALVVAGIGLVAVQLGGWQHRPYGAEETVKWGLVVAGVVSALAFFYLSWHARTPQARLSAFAATPFVAMALGHWAIPERIIERKMPGPFLQQHAERITPHTLVLADSKLAAAAAWYYRRADIHVLLSKGELEYGLRYPDAAGRYLDAAGLARLLADNGGRRPVVVIYKGRDRKAYRDLPLAPVYESEHPYYVFKQL